MKSILYLTTLSIVTTFLLSSCGGKIDLSDVAVRVLGGVEEDLEYCTDDRIADAPYANSTETANDCGTVGTPCTICAGAQFNTIGANTADWNKYFSLESDISLAAYDHTTYNRIGTNNGTHVYAASTPFVGEFDGNGNTINGFTFEDATVRYIGIFGYIGNGGVVKNIILQNVSVQGNNGIGGIAGEVWGGTVEKVTVTGTVLATAEAGCIVGSSMNGTVTKSYSNCTVSSAGSGVGGIIGHGYSGATISKSYAAGNVSGANYVGGISGYMNGGMSIDDSFSFGNVQGNSASSNVGLTSGHADAALTNTHVSGNATCANIGTGNCSGIAGTIQADNAFFYDSTNPPMSTWDFVNDWNEIGGSTPSFIFQ